ncbi:MAG: hypothetical protein M1831_006862 [Alyxoria varia]|nr:MAG: hypothetical protein M1831_006862 [Alyxoria varia]
MTGPHAGLIRLKGNTVSELKDFNRSSWQRSRNHLATVGPNQALQLRSVYASLPSGALASPFSGTDLPEIPSQALKSMKECAGRSNNKGSSQTSGGQPSSGTQTSSKGSAAEQKSESPKPSSSEGAPPISLAPAFIDLVVMLSAFIGAKLL